MKKFIKAICLLLILSCLMQGCSKDKDKQDKTTEDKSSYSSTTNTTTVKDSQTTEEKTTVILNKPTQATTTQAQNKTNTATTAKSNEIKTDTNGLTYVKGILIANKTYSLPSTYNPGVNAEAQSAFNTMAAAASKEGINLFVVSGFRSYSTQETLYNNYVAQDGKANADRYSARPGHSEHQTGLAFDVNSVTNSFKDTKEGKWLAANCSTYGFIIRFPEGKENITGYMYEPWHIRYLGVSTAQAVQKSGLTLEEYLGIDSVYAN